MKKTILSAAALTLVGLPLGAGVLYQEEFDGYGDNPAVFNEGAAIWEAPPSLKTLYFAPKTMSPVRKTPFMFPEPLKNGTALRFRFLFANAAPRDFQIRLYFTNGKEQTVSLKDAVSMARIAAPSWPERLWNDGKIVFENGRIFVTTVRDGQWIPEGPALPAAGDAISGYNFYTGAPMQFDAITARPVSDDVEQFDLPAIARETPAPSVDGNAAALAGDNAFDSIRFRFLCTDAVKPVSVKFVSSDGKSYAYSFQKFSQDFRKSLRVPGKTGYETKSEVVKLEDSGFNIVGPQKLFMSLFTRPKLEWRYLEPEAQKIAANWGRFPAATKSVFDIRLSRDPETANAYRVFLNGNLVQILKTDAPLVSVSVENATVGGARRDVAEDRENASSFKLDIAANRALYGQEKDGLRLAMCRENQGTFFLECDGYLSRSPFEAMPESMLFSVPCAPWKTVRALCQVDPSVPSDFIPVATARLTKFRPGDGRAQAMAQTSVRLPAKAGDVCPPNVKPVPGKPGLYEVEFTFNPGEIQDVLAMEGNERLDFEFLGDTNHKDNYYISRWRAPSDELSSVRVLEAELQRADADFLVTANRLAATYYPNETPGVKIHAVPYGKGPFTVTCAVRDLDGKVLEERKETFTEAKDLAFAFSQKDPGWYGVTLRLLGPDGKEISVRESSFVLIPPDTRKASYESPFFVWNFGGAHGTPSDVNFIGDFLQRWGVRRTLLSRTSEQSEEALKKYGLTLGQFGYMRIEGATPEARDANAKAQIEAQIKLYPSCKTAIIFHESGGGPIPMELLGGKSEVDDNQKKTDKVYAERALELAKAWRKYAPGVRLVVGNSGESIGLLARLFREKFPREYIDAMGEEVVGMTEPPERSTVFAQWGMRRLADLYGCKDLPTDACFEWRSRVIRHLGPRKHAAFVVRDALIALAWDVRTIGLPCPSEMANSYYNTIWGEGACTRYPLMDPFPAAAAVPTLTRILDCAKFSRVVPTGSLSLYCLEFKNAEGFVYAFWSARGTESVAVEGLGADAKLTSLYGTPVKEFNPAKLSVSEEPFYAETKTPVQSVKALGDRVFPAEQYPGSNKAVVAVPLEKAEEIVLSPDADNRIESSTANPFYLAFLRPGKFEVRNATDDVKGACLELELKKEGESSEFMQEYTFLKFRNPVELPGTPGTIGVWVKGNSSAGKLFFELTDASGEKWISAGTGGYGCVVYDWPEQASVNFDNWHFVQFPLTAKSPVKVYTPGESEWQWQRAGASGGPGKMVFPVKVTGLGVSMYRTLPYIKELKDIDPVIRLKALSSY